MIGAVIDLIQSIGLMLISIGLIIHICGEGRNK